MNYLHYLSGLVESESLLGGDPCYCNFSRATKQLQFTYIVYVGATFVRVLISIC